jgi:NAD(P)-dependent dehydrogenase (short-subunit alcohol dehydrogenase family)
VNPLDTALDLTVVPGYTSIGYRLRSRGWDDREIAPGALAGHTVLVTGVTSGIGEAAAERLARLGARVHMVARNLESGVAARERIAERLSDAGREGRSRLELELCDLSDLDAVRSLAAQVLARSPELHGVLHNAAVLPGARERTDQGYELGFATNVLGPFLLTNLLMPALRAGAPSRVVLVSSGGMYTARLDVDDLQLDRREYDGARAYAHTKRIEVILAELWAERERGSGVSFASFHPGWVDTPGLETSLPRFHRLLRPLLRNPGQGADTGVWLLATDAAELHPGAFWHDRRPRPRHRVPWTRIPRADHEQLWNELVRITGTGEPEIKGGSDGALHRHRHNFATAR